MALATGTIFAIQASATTGNTNGSGFNPGNSNFPTDGVVASGTTSTPTLSSATYSFVAGDVGASVYLPAQSNIVPGWYPITSVASGVATLNAAIGQVSTIGSTGVVTYTISAGCATTSAPTGVKYGVDYSQTDSANSTITDAASVGSSSTLTSVTAPWTPVSVGNFFHLTTTGTGGFGLVGWYEIVSYNSASSVVTDRTTNSGTALVAGTGSTGGAGRLNGLEATFMTMLPASAIVWVKNGSYTISGNISGSNTNPTKTLPAFWIGYNSIRGDTCNNANRPQIIGGTNTMSFAQDQCFRNIFFTGSPNNFTLAVGANATMVNCKVTNTGNVGASSSMALDINGTNVAVLGCEIVSQNGAESVLSNTTTLVTMIGCYLHDSDASSAAISCANGAAWLIGNIFEANKNGAFKNSNGGNIVHSNTIYGIESQIGTGVNLTAANSASDQVVNNIFYGLAIGVAVGTGSAGSNISMNNDFFNNTVDVSNWIKDITDLALNPTFTNASQLTGTTATATGGTTTLTDSGATFGVTDGVDYLHITASTGGTGTAIGCYLITSHTATTLTVNNNIGTSGSFTAIHYYVTHGHNFQIGSNLSSAGFNSFTNTTGSQITSYPAIGAVFPQSGGSVVTIAHPFA